MFNWLLKKFENRQKQGKQSSEAWSMNTRIDILPLLATRKIPRSSEINITSHNWIYWPQLTFPEFQFETEAKVDFPSACI